MEKMFISKERKLFDLLHSQSGKILKVKDKDLGGNSQNFLRQIRKIFVTLGLKILGLCRLKVYF